MFEKDGSSRWRRAPKNTFHETDMYTVVAEDGGRDLVLEHGLSGLEDSFARVRQHTLSPENALSADDRLVLCAFVAAMDARTPKRRENTRSQYEPILDHAKRLRARARRGAPMPPALGEGSPVTVDDIEAIVEQPLQSMMVPMIQQLAPLLFRLDLAILQTSEKPGFITSDAPCVWFDPLGHTRHPLHQAPGLMYESIEITLPVSPTHSLLLNRQGLSGYVAAPATLVDDFNRHTRFSCHRQFVVNRDEKRPIWFDPGEEPDNSWRKVQGRRSG